MDNATIIAYSYRCPVRAYQSIMLPIKTAVNIGNISIIGLIAPGKSL